MKKLFFTLAFIGSFGFVYSSYSQVSDIPGENFGFMCCAGGTVWGTDESGHGWENSYKKERTKKGDTCS